MVMDTGIKKKIAALLTTAVQKLPLRIVCPKCGKNRPRKFFGLRVMKRDGQGLPTAIRRQSWCSTCRR
jgi:hypothetical protein